ncbi:putative electron transfer flavoprotein, subunit beta [Candidatus Nitrososphaera gargensis Ga9.2]|uniref:Putative electron transfer flavoprotein, subunit beta n=1 Tax=Nitrososphaera gargensis (strain Ga9.2) TaxID=1237085 RepID=K0IEM7_NITGG|nr:HD domain-containing protein [Candidatus Nitrososphaera gargensis]AFU58205.1 putative electron transfer flavoprotein, subunit beta [Candidatus Nitrososphaera gargensis Ga9.2]
MDELDIPRVSKHEFLAFLQNEAKVRVDNYIEGAIEVAEEVHSDLMREDGTSPFLETHTWPVTMDVVRHYRSVNRNITSVEIVAAILHDVMEDDDRILNLHESKSYGFEAYLAYRFGNRIRDIATELKIKPLENYPGSNDIERQMARFYEYCDILRDAEYDIKAIKLADRLNNMLFIRRVPGHDKVRRYTREAEDFYLAYPMLPPKMPEFYKRMREAYEALKVAPAKKLVAA